MEVLEAIRTRRSIRQFQARPVAKNLVENLLRAGMSAPSARNSRPWHFVLITDRQLLAQAPAVNPNAEMATGAKYLLFTIGQNSGHYCTPNAAYDRIAGITPSKCSRRT